MDKIKKVVFLHDNKIKKTGRFTDMTPEEKLDYHKEKKGNYIQRRLSENKILKEKGAVYKNNLELVIGHST